MGTKEELESLLTYTWDEEKIQAVLDRGTVIEVFLGVEDEIINSKDAYNFFCPLTTVYSMKNVGHLLQ